MIANYEFLRKVAAPPRDAIHETAAEAVVGDCHCATAALNEETGRAPVRPLQVLARAYGMAPEAEA